VDHPEVQLFSETLAESGTAETPAEPIRGFILSSGFKNKFKNFAKVLHQLKRKQKPMHQE